MFSNKFQCCYACNGFSINLRNIAQGTSASVSMLLCLQWVQYRLIVLFERRLLCFNAAMPAMGLVFTSILLCKSSIPQFQCCYACNGFSIFSFYQLVIFKLKYVSMLLCLQWVQYGTSDKYLTEAFMVSMLLCLQWVQYNQFSEGNAQIFICFNAAMPAMGLVYAARVDGKYLLPEFQCCYACNGFSITTYGSKRFKITKSFNAAMPAMGLVYKLSTLISFKVNVSMLLCLQWVQYFCYNTALKPAWTVSMLLCLQWVQYYQIRLTSNPENCWFQCCYACNGFSICT